MCYAYVGKSQCRSVCITLYFVYNQAKKDDTGASVHVVPINTPRVRIRVTRLFQKLGQDTHR